MTKTLTAVFDGKVFRPDFPVDLEPNTRYTLKVEQDIQKPKTQSAWDILEELTGTVEGPEDWSEEHDHYLYGTPKKRKDSSS